MTAFRFSRDTRFNPIYLPEIKKQLSANGWTFKESVDLSEHFIHWYTILLDSFEQKREQVKQQFGQQAWDILYSGCVFRSEMITNSGRI
ncbi:hypothetical protein OQJ19_17015 [Fluoribacter gormanii]|uniref:hypothetical protein n=1 Tax=Fluoribacter gormanii TaxID=464 RepID=UPI002243803F|nr:hypothetical protein [Fluoribacter gormanii]MCW8472334.1 hypothetical protein [Fluoribacter gormanii]